MSRIWTVTCSGEDIPDRRNVLRKGTELTNGKESQLTDARGAVIVVDG